MISVIIPAYNVDKYIEECIESLLNQTYKDIEIIVINDGSTDNTESKIKRYSESIDNIEYVYQDNRGVSEARNLGLSLAKGEFVYFMDPDDYIEPEMLELMYKGIKGKSADLVICGYRSFYDDVRKNGEVNLYKLDESKVYDREYAINKMLSLELTGYVWDKLFRRNNLIKNNFYFESGRYIQDWFPVFKEVYNSERIAFVNKPLYNYRLRDNSTVHKRNEKLVEDYYYAVNKILRFVENEDIKIDKNKIINFKASTFYTLMLGYYLYHCNENPKNKRSVYKKFLKSKYSDYEVSFMELLSGKRLGKTELKILMWKMKIFHLIYR